MNDIDVAVIGGGVIGLSCVLHLLDQRPGLVISVIDAPTRPGIASQAAAGMLAPFAEFHTESPLFHLSRRGLDYYPEFLRQIGLQEDKELGFLDTGTLIPSNGKWEGHAQSVAALARQFGPVEEVTGSALYDIEPALAGGCISSAFLTRGAVINAGRLHSELWRIAEERGVRIIRDEVSGVEVKHGTALGLRTRGNRRVSFETLIVASGAWSRVLSRVLGLSVDLIPVKGQLARYAVPNGFLRHVIHCPEVYLAPRPGYGILFGASMEEVGFQEGVSDETVERMRAQAEDLVPKFRHCMIAESWFGFRPRFRDGAPAIGWSQRIKNLLIATGHFRNGILLTPITGKIIAEEYMKERKRTDGFFSPARLGL